MIERFVAVDKLDELCDKLHFTGSIYSANNPILVFWHHGILGMQISQSDQCMHIRMGHSTTAMVFFLSRRVKYSHQNLGTRSMVKFSKEEIKACTLSRYLFIVTSLAS